MSDTFHTGSFDGTAPRMDRLELIRRLRRLNAIARTMDTAIRIPFTGIRFGADSVMGLIPGIGDAGGALIGLAIVNEARRLGVPSHKLGRMLGNLGIDAAVGSVPLLGDLFDLYFKSHKRNIAMIFDHFDLDPAELEARPR